MAEWRGGGGILSSLPLKGLVYSYDEQIASPNSQRNTK